MTHSFSPARRRGGRGHDLVIGALDKPVEILAGMVVPIAQKPRVGTERHILHQLVDHFGLIGQLHVQIFLDLRSVDAEVAGHADNAQLGLLLHADDLRASLCGGTRGANA